MALLERFELRRLKYVDSVVATAPTSMPESTKVIAIGANGCLKYCSAWPRRKKRGATRQIDGGRWNMGESRQAPDPQNKTRKSRNIDHLNRGDSSYSGHKY